MRHTTARPRQVRAPCPDLSHCLPASSSVQPFRIILSRRTSLVLERFSAVHVWVGAVIAICRRCLSESAPFSPCYPACGAYVFRNALICACLCLKCVCVCVPSPLCHSPLPLQAPLYTRVGASVPFPRYWWHRRLLVLLGRAHRHRSKCAHQSTRGKTDYPCHMVG